MLNPTFIFLGTVSPWASFAPIHSCHLPALPTWILLAMPQCMHPFASLCTQAAHSFLPSATRQWRVWWVRRSCCVPCLASPPCCSTWLQRLQITCSPPQVGQCSYARCLGPSELNGSTSMRLQEQSCYQTKHLPLLLHVMSSSQQCLQL